MYDISIVFYFCYRLRTGSVSVSMMAVFPLVVSPGLNPPLLPPTGSLSLLKSMETYKTI